MTAKYAGRLHRGELEVLFDAIEIECLRLAECRVSAGWQLDCGTTPALGLHYNLSGRGRMIVADETSIELLPHTLVIVPPGLGFLLQAPVPGAHRPLRAATASLDEIKPGSFQRFSAGPPPSDLDLICGYFHVRIGGAVDPFASLSTVVVEHFDERDHASGLLRHAREELARDEVGSAAMSGVLVKQILLTILRRSLREPGRWAERFSALSDPQITRAFVAMVADPAAAHSVASLARRAALSRSAFMARFTRLFGRSAMTALRHLRLKQAGALMALGTLSVEEVARRVGYRSRTSFARAFEQHYGKPPGRIHED